MNRPIDYVLHESIRTMAADGSSKTVRCWTLYDENDGVVGMAYPPDVLASDWVFTDRSGGWSMLKPPITLTRLCELMVVARLLGEPDE
jgi:hypothetical protein